MRERPAPERRREPRFESTPRYSATLKINGRQISGCLTDLSLRGACFLTSVELAPETLAEASGELQAQELLDGAWPVRVARFVQSGEEPLSFYVGLLLDPEGQQKIFDLSFRREDRNWDLLQKKEEIEQIFDDIELLERRLPFYLERGGQNTPAVFLSEERKKKWLFFSSPMENHPELGEEVAISFELFEAFYIFRAPVVMVGQEALALRHPKAIVRLFRRATSRLPLHPGEGKLQCRLNGQAEPITTAALDLCERGISADPDPKVCLYPVGRVVRGARLSIGDQIDVSLDLVFRGLGANGRWRFGFTFADEKARERLVSYVMHRRYPGYSFEYQDEDHDKIWDLFDKSGYLDEKSRESFDPIHKITNTAWRRLEHCRPRVSQRIIKREGERIVGHLQIDKLYQNSWLVHHLAIAPDTSKIVAKEIYTSLTDLLINMNIQHVISYHNSEKPWNQRNYYEFIKTYPYLGDNDLTVEKFYELSFAQWKSQNDQSNDYVIKDLSSFEKERLLHYMASLFSLLKRHAFSLLSKKDLCLEETLRDFEQGGLRKNRKIFVARRGRNTLAYAFVESGESGTNIFSLTDSVRIFFCVDLNLQEKQALANSLLQTAVAFLASQKKSGLLLWSRNTELHPWYISRGMRSICNCSCWVADQRNFIRYRVFISSLYGRLLAKRAKIKMEIRDRKREP